METRITRFAKAACPVVLLTSTLAALLPATLSADVWLFEPSVGLDQRIDDNFELDPFRETAVAATRAVASAKLSREDQRFLFLGQARVDGLLTVNEDEANELNSNQILFFDTQWLRPRSRFGLEFTFRRDTPSRDISADITDLSQTAEDTGTIVTQDQNVDRDRIVFKPSYRYDLSRRTELSFAYTYTDVDHGLPSAQDAIDRQVLGILANPLTPQALRDTLLNLGRPAEINDIGRFTISGELDDFTENLFEFGFRHLWSRRDTISATLSFSGFEAQSEIVDTPEGERDEIAPNILRNPRAATTVDTARIVFGYDRKFSPTFNAGIQIGYFNADSDNFGVTESNDGYTALLSALRIGNLDRYSVRFGVEVFPSEIGDVVETLELIGDYQRNLSQLTTFNLQLRAFEPDAISDAADADRFARRFISIEPRIIWRFSRAWTAAASYRYRRQKSQVDPQSGDSNALLFSLTYTPPSALRDARRRGGLIERAPDEADN